MRKAWKLAAAAAVLSGLAAAGCGQRPLVQTAQAPSSASAAAQAGQVAVPQLAAMAVADADKVLAKTGLISILRYEPGIVTGAGTVVNTDPPVGSMRAVGDIVTVIVAGSPRETLHDYVDAHREMFIGIGLDANGVLVVGVHESADLTLQMAQLSSLAKGKSFRVQTCSRSWTDLMRVQHELSRREFLPGADQMAFASAIDPLACAVRLTIDLPDAQVAELTARYKGALVIQKGSASRLG